MSDNFLPLLADRILNRPLLLHPDKAATIMHVLEGRITIGSIGDQPKPDASRFVGTTRRGDGTGRRFTRAAERTALITIDGSLVNRGAWIGASSGLTSYEGIAAELDEVAAEARAGRIDNLILDVNSYGGEATGMFNLAAKIRSMRQSMRVVAVVNDVAASAGYGLTSSAHEVVISPTSLVGSIGVVMMHLDRSAEMSAKGINPTFIHAGAKKVDGHPFGPLPEDVRADMQRDVIAFYDRFIETVEAGRGKDRLSAKKARATEADVFIGQEAIDAGLADRMASLDEVLAGLSRPRRGKSSSTPRRSEMYRDEDVTEAVASERARIKSILELPEAQGRQTAARSLAFTADLSADAAKATLAALPEETIAEAGSGRAVSTVPSIGQRAGEHREVGSFGRVDGVAPETTRAGWANAVSAINARFE